MRGQGSVESELHHEGLGVRQLLFLSPVEGELHEKILCQYTLDDLEVLVRVVGLGEGLLAGQLLGPEHVMSVQAPVDTILRHQQVVTRATNLIQPLLLLFGAFLEEYLPQHVFLLLVRIVVFYIVVVGLIKYGI